MKHFADRGRIIQAFHTAAEFDTVQYAVGWDFSVWMCGLSMGNCIWLYHLAGKMATVCICQY